jgi:trigger factor
MQIAKEKIDDLNIVLNIELSPEDYQEKYNESLKSYGKKVSIPGFRPGKVPGGIIKKKYGKALLAEELNKVINDTLNKYIQDEKLNILGSPLPKEDDLENGNWDQPSNFTFKYDIGLAPDVDINLAKIAKQDYLLIDIDKKMIDNHIAEMQKRKGSLKAVELAGEKDMIMGTFVQLDDKDEIIAGGIMHDSTISLEFIEDKATKKKLVGKKPGEFVVLDPKKVSKGDADLAKMLGIDVEEVAALEGNFRFNINEIKSLIPAELNAEFFNSIGSEGEITSVEDLKKKIIEDTEKQFLNESDRLFINTMSKYLVEKTALSLPDDFLKRWIKVSNDKPITDEQIASEYDSYAKSLKWQMIENKIAEMAEIKIESEELVNMAKNYIVSQYAQYGLPAPQDENLDAQAKQILSNQEESRRMYEILLEQKIIAYLKEKVKINEKKVSYDDFVKAAQAL